MKKKNICTIKIKMAAEAVGSVQLLSFNNKLLQTMLFLLEHDFFSFVWFDNYELTKCHLVAVCFQICFNINSKCSEHFEFRECSEH